MPPPTQALPQRWVLPNSLLYCPSKGTDVLGLALRIKSMEASTMSLEIRRTTHGGHREWFLDERCG
jgi:hypothetical protein